MCIVKMKKGCKHCTIYKKNESLDFYHVSCVYEHESKIKMGGSIIKKGELVLSSWESTWIKL
jgi:hypothetical protein